MERTPSAATALANVHLGRGAGSSRSGIAILPARISRVTCATARATCLVS